jgi:hypothetical protein
MDQQTTPQVNNLEPEKIITPESVKTTTDDSIFRKKMHKIWLIIVAFLIILILIMFSIVVLPLLTNTKDPDSGQKTDNILLPTANLTPTTATVDLTDSDDAAELIKCDVYSDQYVEFKCPDNGSAIALNEGGSFFGVPTDNAIGVFGLVIDAPKYTIRVNQWQGGFGEYVYDPAQPLSVTENPEGGYPSTITLTKAPKIYKLHNGAQAMLADLNEGLSLYFNQGNWIEAGKMELNNYSDEHNTAFWNNTDFTFIKWNGIYNNFSFAENDFSNMISITPKQTLDESTADEIINYLNVLMSTYKFKF